MGGDGDENDGAKELMRKESRAVLDHQLSTLSDLDDKAMWTVRTAVIIMSIVISALGVGATNGEVEVHWAPIVMGGLGLLAMAVTAGLGSLIYASSVVPYGPGEAYREEVRIVGVDQERLLTDLLEGYDEWIPKARKEVSRNANAFSTLQSVFLFGIWELLLAGGFGAISLADWLNEWDILVVAGLLHLVVGVLLYLDD